MTSPIRILFPQFADGDNYDAVSLATRQIVLRLAPDRHLCTLFHSREPDPRLTGLDHVRLCKIPSRLGSLKMLRESLRRYDILFCPSGALRFLELYLRTPRALRRPTVTVQWILGPFDTDLDPDPNSAARRQRARYMSQVDEWVANTARLAEIGREQFGIHCRETIPIGIDSAIFTDVPREDRLRDAVHAIFVGHLIERKGAHLVLEAARALPEVRFRLVGRARDDAYARGLRGRIRDWQLANVEILEPMPQKELVGLLADSDVLIHPSRVEGMPMAVLEGAATGLPALIFDDYRAPVVVDGATGFEVSTFDEMLDRLRSLVEDRELRLRLGRAAARHARQYSWERVAASWQDVFASIAPRRNGERRGSSPLG